MRTSALMAAAVLIAAAGCSEDSGPTVAGTLNDTIITAPTRFAGVPGAQGGFGSIIRDTLGVQMFVPNDSIVWTIADSAIASVPLHELSGWGVVGGSPGNTVVRVSYNGDTTSVDVEVATAAFTRLVAGGRYSCALDTTHRLYCWGFNLDNRVGQPYGVGYPGPARPPLDPTYESIDLSLTHACGITSAHVLKCWGGNAYGERGNGDPGPGGGIWQAVPVSGGLQFGFVRTGSGITCGLTTDSLAYCWGRNYQGELGAGDTLLRNTPAAVSGGRKFSQIDADGAWLDATTTHTCALDLTGHLWCWGNNTDGQLGDGTLVDKWIPTAIDTGRTYTQVSVGGATTCALGTDTKVYCWGDNQYGQIGHDTTSVDRPLAITSASSYTAISVGEAHACALSTTGEIDCWGANGNGQLGRGTLGDGNHKDVVAVTGGMTWTDVSAGWRHTCGRSSAGFYYCWGGFDTEQGTGLTPSGTPTLVMGQTGASPSR